MPIFAGFDPVEVELVASMSRPGGNVTGVSILDVELGPKRLQLLHELVPSATIVALLVNPTDPARAETTSKELQAPAHTLGLQLHVLHASTDRDFDTVFARLVELRAGGLVSYGGSLTDAYRLVGIFTGRILRGEKPADLPVQQATKVEMVINLKTAKILGLAVPQSLLGRADEVID